VTEYLSDELKTLVVVLDERFNAINKRFDRLESKVDNLAAQQEQLGIEIGAVDTRLSSVERVVNQLASRAGIQSLPALGGNRAGLPLAAKTPENT